MAKTGKIICPGLGRTGTTSLAQALNILGYNTQESVGSWYWVELEGGRLVFNPNRDEGDKFDAYADSPIPLIYKNLVELYPDSRVILTTRPLDSWLLSTEKLIESVKSFAASSEDPDFNIEIVNMYHQQMFGANSFDADLFSKRYKEHNAEVRDFFRAHSERFLEIQLTEKGSWNELCEFLDEPIPDVPFPWRNKTTPVRKMLFRLAGMFGLR